MNEFLFSVPFSGSRSNPVDPNSDLSSYRSSRDSLAYSKYPRIQVEACGHLVCLSWHGLVLGMAIFPDHTQAVFSSYVHVTLERAADPDYLVT